MDRKCDPVVIQRVNEIRETGVAHPAVCVMLDGRPDKTEWMTLLNTTVNADEDGFVYAECEVMDLELGRWTVDVRHICGVRKQ